MQRAEAKVPRAVLDRAVYEALPPTSLCLALLLLFFSVAHRLVLGPEVAHPLSVAALASSVVFFVLWLVVRRGRLALSWRTRSPSPSPRWLCSTRRFT